MSDTNGDGQTVEVSFDFDHLTVEEMEEIEERSGQSLDTLEELLGNGKPKAKLLRLFAYIAKRREDPSFTWEDAGKLRIKIVEDDAAVPPTAAAGSGSRRRSSTSTPA